MRDSPERIFGDNFLAKGLKFEFREIRKSDMIKTKFIPLFSIELIRFFLKNFTRGRFSSFRQREGTLNKERRHTAEIIVTNCLN